MTEGRHALEALGDPTRRQILKILGQGERSVRELSDELPMTRPAVSHHLRVLREAQLVRVRPEGTRRVYGVEPTGLAEVQAFMEEVWGNALTRFKLVAENTTRDRDR